MLLKLLRTVVIYVLIDIILFNFISDCMLHCKSYNMYGLKHISFEIVRGFINRSNIHMVR